MLCKRTEQNRIIIDILKQTHYHFINQNKIRSCVILSCSNLIIADTDRTVVVLFCFILF